MEPAQLIGVSYVSPPASYRKYRHNKLKVKSSSQASAQSSSGQVDLGFTRLTLTGRPRSFTPSRFFSAARAQLSLQ
jgi:hypothetical protein